MSGRDRPKSVQEDHRTLRVAFATLEEFRQEFETNLARGGLFVPSEEEAELREEVMVELALEFRGSRVQLPAEVVAVVPPELAHNGGTPGVAVQLLVPAQELAARFEPILGATPPPKPAKKKPAAAAAPERRRAPRQRARVMGRLSSADASLAVRTRDLSHAGVLVTIEGVAPAPVGTSVSLALVHPVTSQSLEVEGTVVRHVEDEGDVLALAVAFSTREAARPEVQRFVDDLQTASHARGLAGIRGDIAEVGLASLVQSFAAASREGTLHLSRGPEEGSIAFAGGELVGARLGAVTGMKALARMLEWSKGAFDFHAQVQDADREGEPIALEAALLDATRQVDERARLEPLPLRRSDRFALRREQSTQPLEKTEQAVLDLAGAGFTLRAMLDVIPDEDHQILRAVLMLLELGLLAKKTA
jgi:Tfp pilus assembly protein PilZ